jgi:hypothetical protein
MQVDLLVGPIVRAVSGASTGIEIVWSFDALQKA